MTDKMNTESNTDFMPANELIQTNYYLTFIDVILKISKLIELYF